MAASALSWADDAQAVDRPLQGLPLEEALSQLMADGLPVVYSSGLVRPELRVAREPEAVALREILDELLAPHGLGAREMAGGRLVVMRRPASSSVAESAAAVPDTHAPPPRDPEPLAEIVVTGSRYQFLRFAEPGRFALGVEDLERLPDLGDDPVRAVARLPGVATGGFTARSNIRGGDTNETLVRFDGFRLYNPFHLKDFQGLFSTIDPALVRSVEIHTGGFPIGMGDRMSGVIDIEPVAPPAERVGIASLGLFSAGLMASESFDEGRSEWLISARRGNLDLLVDAADPSRGKPRYFDLHARIGHRFSDRLLMRGSLLRFQDDLEISDEDQEENATATYEDIYYWLSVDWAPRADLASRSFAGVATLDSRRRGTAAQPGISTGSLADRRESDMALFETHWQWRRSETSTFDFGAEYRRSSGHYAYEDEVQFDLLFDTPGAPDYEQRIRSLALRPEGDHVAVYAGVQYAMTPDVAVDAGLRYDRDTLPARDERQWSPRAGVQWAANEDLQLSASWGRYAQSQSVQELQISDGVLEYLPPQRADHLLLGLRYRLTPAVDVRLDTYEKRYEALQPRYENLLNSFVILPELKPDRVRVEADQAVVRGAELSVRSRDDVPQSWWLNYSWSRAQDRIAGDDVPRSWDQTHALGAGLGWRRGSWDVSAAVAWHSGWPTTAAKLGTVEPMPIATVGPRNARRLGSFFSLDLRTSRRFVLDASLLTVFLELTNVTNRSNDCCTEYEFNTESGEPALEVEAAPSLPLLPNLGFVWEF